MSTATVCWQKTEGDEMGAFLVVEACDIRDSYGCHSFHSPRFRLHLDLWRPGLCALPPAGHLGGRPAAGARAAHRRAGSRLLGAEGLAGTPPQRALVQSIAINLVEF